MTHSRLLALALSVPFAACAPSQPAPGDAALHVDQHDNASVRGSFVAGAKLEFSSVMARPATATVTVTIGDDTLTLYADAVSGEIRFDSADARLTATEVDTLGAFTRALDGYIGGADDIAVMHESLLLSAATYFAAAPADTVLSDAFHITSKDTAGALGSDGKTCIKPGQSRVATFDGSNGIHNETWTVGAHGGVQWNGDFAAMGRCGVGDGSYDWTQDCLEHDACSRRYYASTGPVDHNCGDEYADAADDYASFWKRCYR